MANPAASSAPSPSGGPARGWLVRLWPVVVLAAGCALFYAFRLDRHIGFETLKEHRVVLLDLVGRHAVAMSLAYVALYTASVAFSLPVGAVLTVTGGFLFGQWLGAGLAVVGATAGALLVFLAARTALAEPLRARAGPWLRKMEQGFGRNAFSYLLVLRLVPVFPFFAVNLVPAFLGVAIKTYALATAVGIVPATFVYAAVGVGLGSIFERGDRFSAAGVLTPQLVLALMGLACLALVPVVYKAVKAARGRART